MKGNGWMPGLFALLFGTDAMVRQYVEEGLEPGETRMLPGGRLMLRKVHNPGFAMGILEDRPQTVKKLTGAAAVLVFAGWSGLFFLRGRRIEKAGCTLAAAGAAGNLLDRVRSGKVTDYIALTSGPSFLTRLTANLADLYLAAGALILAGRRIL